MSWPLTFIAAAVVVLAPVDYAGFCGDSGLVQIRRQARLEFKAKDSRRFTGITCAAQSRLCVDWKQPPSSPAAEQPQGSCLVKPKHKVVTLRLFKSTSNLSPPISICHPPIFPGARLPHPTS